VGQIKARNDATKKRSKVTGKKFNRQDPNGRRHGPMPRRKVYALAIEKVLCSHWAVNPLTSIEIADLANHHISKHWTQLNGYSAGAILRKYEKEGIVTSGKKYENGKGLKTWLRNWDAPLESDYEFHGGNWKGDKPRVWYTDPITGKRKTATATNKNLEKISKINRGG